MRMPPVLPWGGDAPQSCHSLFLPHRRSRPVWPDRAEERVELAVVGAGLSGLTAAQYLRDREVMVLEAESRIGGVCLPGSYQGIPYPAGSAYFYEPDEAAGRAWFQELGLDLEDALVAPPASALYHGGVWYPDCFSPAGLRTLPLSPQVQEGLIRFAGELAELEETWEPLGAEILSYPELDGYSLRDYLETERGFPPELTRLFDPYTRSCLGAGPEDISAWAGLVFLMSEFSPTSRIAAFPEGNARLIGALAASLAKPVKVQQTVMGLHIEPDAINLLVWDGKARRLWRLMAGAVIVAAGKFLARRLLPPNCGWDLENFRAFRYSSYVVAALCGRLSLRAPGFENWVVGEGAFSDFIVAPRTAPPGTSRVMVVYAPQPSLQGRELLLHREPEDMAREILLAVDCQFPGTGGEVEEIHLYRFGHAQVVPYPGFLTFLKSRLTSQQGRLILANADLEGLPCVEAAILQGRQAARRAREVLGV